MQGKRDGESNVGAELKLRQQIEAKCELGRKSTIREKQMRRFSQLGKEKPDDKNAQVEEVPKPPKSEAEIKEDEIRSGKISQLKGKLSRR